MKQEIHAYAAELAANIRAERGRAAISGRMLAARMRRLGFSSWTYQAVSKVENAQRPVTAPEVMGLCMAMGCTVWDLMAAAPFNHLVGYPGYGPEHRFSGLTGGADNVDVIGARSVTSIAQGVWDGSLQWDGAEIAVRHITSFGDVNGRLGLVIRRGVSYSIGPSSRGEPG